MMRRREFITLVGGAATWPLAARAQQARLPVIGVLMAATPQNLEATARIAAFLETLTKLGWTDQRNVRIEYRWSAVGRVEASDAAAELVGLEPKVILAQGSPISEALLKATHTVPIVFVAASDPVNTGLVASMSRPGGNLTGFTNFEFPLGGKWLELLKEAAPHTRRMLVMYSAGNTGSEGFLDTLRTAGVQHDVQVIEKAIRRALEIEYSVTAFAQHPEGGLIVLPSASLALE